jgi:hypothetical protein
MSFWRSATFVRRDLELMTMTSVSIDRGVGDDAAEHAAEVDDVLLVGAQLDRGRRLVDRVSP